MMKNLPPLMRVRATQPLDEPVLPAGEDRGSAASKVTLELAEDDSSRRRGYDPYNKHTVARSVWDHLRRRA